MSHYVIIKNQNKTYWQNTYKKYNTLNYFQVFITEQGKKTRKLFSYILYTITSCTKVLNFSIFKIKEALGQYLKNTKYRHFVKILHFGQTFFKK